jgi:DNA gyrase subunit A
MADEFNAGKIIQSRITDEMKKAYLDYAMSVIVSRSIPDVRDGLKPVHRRILYAMYKDLGLTHDHKYQKCAGVVGEVMKKYHPHGDMAIYDSLVRLAQDFNMRYMLVDGQGNFGSVDGDSPAAMRYTEARLREIAEELLRDINKETVDFMPNYDGEHEQPVYLPSYLPNLLLNGSDGIAVGMATKIPPHNLSEIIDALTYTIEQGKPEAAATQSREDTSVAELLERATGQGEAIVDFSEGDDLDEQILIGEVHAHPKAQFSSDVTVEDLTKFIKGPDFPTGGVIYDQTEITAAYATGKGRIVMRAVASIEEQKNGRFTIIVTELPYQVNKAMLVAKIAELVKDKRIDGISDLRDESDREGMRIVVELKASANPQSVLNKLYKYTSMQMAYNANMIALVNGQPQVLTLKTALEEYIKHRQLVVIRRTEYDLRKAKERAHVLEGLKIALDHLDEVITTIRQSSSQEDARQALIAKFGMSEIQATAVLDLQLRRLAALERQKIEDELKAVLALIDELEGILADPYKVLSIIKTELAEMKEKYGDERKTKVVKGKVGELSDADLIADEEVLVTLTKSGYVKRLSPTTYRQQNRGGRGVAGMTLKEEDVISNILTARTHDDMFFFTNKGRVFSIKVYEIPESSRQAKGQAIVNLIQIEQGERVTAMLTQTKEGRMIAADGADEEGSQPMPQYLLMATVKGTVKKTTLSEYKNIRKSGLAAIRLLGDDELAWVKPTTGQDDVIIATREGKSIHFSENDISPTGRATIGVRGIKVGAGDECIGMDIIPAGTDEKKTQLLVVAENGFGKMTAISQYTKQGRGGQGILTFRINDKTGKLVVMRLISATETADVLITSVQGVVIRIPLKGLPSLGRQTSGVKIIRLGESDKVAAIAYLPEDQASSVAVQDDLVSDVMNAAE